MSRYETLLMGLTYTRNPIRAKVFREAGYVEKLDSGMTTIFESYRKRELLTPDVAEGPDFVESILPRPTPSDEPIIYDDEVLEKIARLFAAKVETFYGANCF